MMEFEKNEENVNKEEKAFVPKKVRWNVSSAIEIVYDSLSESNLEIIRNEKYNTAIERLKNYFNLDEVKVWIMCIAIDRYFKNSRGGIDLDDVSRFIGCRIFKIMNWTTAINELCENQYLGKRESRGDYLDDDPTVCFGINPTIVVSVAENKTFHIEKEIKDIDYVEFIHIMARKFENRRDEEKSTVRLIREMSSIEQQNTKLPIVVECKKILEKKDVRYFFYDMCDDFLCGNDTAMERTICDMYDSASRYRIAKEMMDENHPLFKAELIEFTRKGSMRDATMTLTEKGKELLLGEDAVLFEKQLDDKMLIKADSITAKKLYYSEENQKQLDRLREALDEEKLPAIQERLKESGMPIGIAVLLHGAPGTGKTESVYQIARETGRHIVHVDISDSKSCWFGESEKKIKQIFVRYKSMCKTALKSTGKIPILLFNEADAIFAKRKDTTMSNVAQTENAIQNIILEEMENLQGILVATTNLASNLDPAFERRFLFKIQFENPSVAAKKAIWLDKLNWLSEKDAEQFAKTYELSGGQIDNIVRKITMNEVITGKHPEIFEIDDMCVCEKLNKNEVRRVGFAS